MLRDVAGGGGCGVVDDDESVGGGADGCTVVGAVAVDVAEDEEDADKELSLL